MSGMVSERGRDITPDGEINLYFFSILPLDFFPILGIAQIAMAMDPMVRTHLIRAKYPRHINPEYFSYFTSVHYLPYFFYQISEECDEGVGRCARVPTGGGGDTDPAEQPLFLPGDIRTAGAPPP